MKNRFDERDTIFSRMLLEPGTERYAEYYRRRPEREKIDTELRNAPPGVFADREPEQTIVHATFSLIAQLRPLVRGGQNDRRHAPDDNYVPAPESTTETVGKLARSFGAAEVGICVSDPAFFYSVRGRGERYGTEVPEIPAFTIVMAFEMDKEKTAAAPYVTQTVEVARAYLDAAKAALGVREFIADLGFSAVAHIDGESEIVLPPAAAAAGIGATGRHGLLVHPKYGSRIRLSAVTTDVPLLPAPASTFQIVQFCESCGLCARLCPKNAIPAGPADNTGCRVWQTDHELCYEGWTEFGTDCGVCLAVCPFSGIRPENIRGGKNAPGEPGFLKSFMYGGNQ